jgi:hypothetical protein
MVDTGLGLKLGESGLEGVICTEGGLVDTGESPEGHCHRLLYVKILNNVIILWKFVF